MIYTTKLVDDENQHVENVFNTLVIINNKIGNLRKYFFFSSVISNQSTCVLHELMCWLTLVVRSPPARRSLSWIQSTVD